MDAWVIKLVACSGPGAHRAIAEAVAFGYWSALGVGLLLVPTVARYLLRRQLRAAGVHLSLIALHPAWCVSASRGDCGGLKTQLSVVFLVMTFGLWLSSPAISRALLQRGRPNTPRQGFPVMPPPPTSPVDESGRAARSD
jgi:hypothetical protein